MVNEFIDDELNPQERTAFELHLLQCAACQKELEELLALQYTIASLPTTIQPNRDLWKGIEASFHPQPQPLTSGLEERKNGKARTLQFTSRSQAFSWHFRAAAVLLVLAAAGVVWMTLRNPEQQQVVSTRQLEIQPPPEARTLPPPANIVQIPDGGGDPESATDDSDEPAVATGGAKVITENSKPTPPESNQLVASSSETLEQRLQQGLQLAPTPLRPSSAGRIIGSVTDDRGNPVIGMTVELVGTTRRALTDNEGLFEFFGLATQTYALQVRGMGYQQKVINDVKIIPGFTTQVSFQLNSGSISLKDIATNKESILAQLSSSLPPGELPLALYVEPSTRSRKLTIEGKVSDEHGRAIVGAVVLVQGTRRGAYSDNEGKFHIYGVPDGSYTLQAIARGYQQKDTSGVQIAFEFPIEVNIALDGEADR
jgi:protocatechuate 3,4-dioxygenase beta subunit